MISLKKEIELSPSSVFKSMPKFRELFGFEISDFSSWNSFRNLLHRPMDPSLLAYVRIAYGTYICGETYVTLFKLILSVYLKREFDVAGSFPRTGTFSGRSNLGR